MKQNSRALASVGYIVVAGALLLLTMSCIGVDSSMEVNDDGSGSIMLSYRISKSIALLGQLDDQDTAVPLPVNREDFERTVSRNPGLVLQDFEQSENEEDVFIDAVLSFSSISALNGFLKSGEEETVVLNREGDSTTLSFLLFPGTEEDISEENLSFFSTVFEGYTISMSITAPSDIQSVSTDMNTTDQRTASVEYLVPELVTSRQPVSFSLTW